MVATVPTRGVLKASQNRVRTSVALQGNAMWENVIGVVNEQAGSNSGVEALIRAPAHGGGRKAAAERRAAAQSAVLATGGFDTAITNYQSLLSLAKSQGAVGGGADRGACRICGHVGHLTRQCRNILPGSGEGDGGAGPSAVGGAGLALEDDDNALSDIQESDLDLSSDSDSDSDRKKKRSRKSSNKHKHKKSHKKSKKHKKKSRRSDSD